MPDTLVPGMVHLTARKAARKTDHRTELRAAIERLYEYSPHSVGKEWAGGPARERIPELRAGRMSKSFGCDTEWHPAVSLVAAAACFAIKRDLRGSSR